jgi:hypothetical protein
MLESRGKKQDTRKEKVTSLRLVQRTPPLTEQSPHKIRQKSNEETILCPPAVTMTKEKEGKPER